VWLYIPDLPSSQGVEDLNSDSPLRSELITKQSPTLKGSVRPLRSWLRTWNEGGWIRLLSGMTLQPSQAMPLAHSWITSTLSQRDSLASRGQSQEAEREPRTNDGSGLTSSDWFARYDPEASSWKTSQVSFMEELNTFSETWPRSGSMRNGQVFEHQTLVRPIPYHRRERGLYLGSRTGKQQPFRASTADSRADGTSGAVAAGTSGELGITSSSGRSTGRHREREHKVRDNGTGRLRKISNNGESGSLGLAREVKHWGTPRASSANGSSQKERDEGNPKGRLETGAETWMTPTARDFKDGDGTANVETNGLLGRQAPRTPMPGQESQNDTGQRLNPIFVTALMGWREGWLDLTNSESSATE
jgi:hypothetical protein